jgi:hypothetical protein
LPPDEVGRILLAEAAVGLERVEERKGGGGDLDLVAAAAAFGEGGVSAVSWIASGSAVTEGSGSGSGAGVGGVGVRITGGVTGAGNGSSNFGLAIGDATFGARSGLPGLTGFRLFLQLGTSLLAVAC